MTQKEIILLMSYIRNNLDRLEEDVKKLQSNVRFRHVDISDCFELISSICYLNAFKDVTTDIRYLLNLYPSQKENFCIYCRKCLFLGAECEGFRCRLPSCDGDSCAYEKDFAWCFTPENRKTGE